MDRTGLIVALSVAAMVGIVFALWPELDLRLAALFYDPETKRFLSQVHPWLNWLRDGAMWLVAAIVAPALVALAVKAVWPRRPLLVSARAILFLTATLAVGPGLVVNMTFKEHWGRPRPADVTQLGGEQQFKPWWDFRGTCPTNCSFASGDASGAFWTLAPAALAPPAWRPAAYAAAVTFGSAVGVLRMVFGGHFFTDVVFAGVIVFLIIWVAHGLIYRWPRTRLSDRAMESWMERRAIAGQSRLARLFGAGRQGGA